MGSTPNQKRSIALRLVSCVIALVTILCYIHWGARSGLAPRRFHNAVHGDKVAVDDPMAVMCTRVELGHLRRSATWVRITIYAIVATQWY